MNRKARRVRQGVRDRDRLDRKRAEFHLAFFRVGDQLRAARQPVFAEFFADHAQRQRGSIDREGQLFEDERQSADVVFVSVRDADRFDFIAVFQQVRDVGYNQVNPRLLLVGEHDAAVHHNNRVVVLEGQHILADVTAAAERKDQKFSVQSAILFHNRPKEQDFSRREAFLLHELPRIYHEGTRRRRHSHSCLICDEFVAFRGEN